MTRKDFCFAPLIFVESRNRNRETFCRPLYEVEYLHFFYEDSSILGSTSTLTSTDMRYL